MRLPGELPFTGEIVWLTSEQGGRASGPPRTPADQDYAATAYIPPATLDDGLASIVVRVSDNTAWRSAATARWLSVENEGIYWVERGTVLVVTEGPRPVAYFHVQSVAHT